MIKLNIVKDDIKDPSRFASILRTALEHHTINVVQTVQQDKKYYMGELPNVEYVINKVKYICDMATEMFIGEVPDFTTYSEKEKQRKSLIEFKKRIRASGFNKEIYNAGHNASIAGSGFILLYTEDNDTFPRYASLDPEFTNVVYDNHVVERPMFGFTLVKQEEVLPNSQTNTYYKVFVYTDEYMYELRTISLGDLTISGQIPPYGDVDMLSRKVIPHNFKFLPLIQIKNNEHEIGDARPVYKLIDALNSLQNDRLKNVKDVVNYMLMLKNVRVGNEEEQENMVELIKKYRLLPLEGENVDAKFLTNPLDQTALQKLNDYTEGLIHKIARVPDFNASEFAQNSSEPALKLKLKSFLDLAKEKEREFTGALSQIIELTLDFVSNFGGRMGQKYLFDMNDIEIEYSHALPSNDYEKITQFVSLNQMGLLNPNVALQQLSWIKNVDEYMMGVKSLTQEEIVAVQNGGNNETNRERQMLATTDATEVDNELANAQGVAQNLK
jgi:SPP1 family phage portal protein